MTRRRAALVSPLLVSPLLVSSLALCLLLMPASRAQTPREAEAASRIVGEVFTQGRQLEYVSALSDRIGSRLTGRRASGARRESGNSDCGMRISDCGLIRAGAVGRGSRQGREK